MEARSWIASDESAKEMLARTLAQRPCLLPPPLHRVPIRAGNVVEIVGPSASAKSEILLQVAVNCMLPKEWNGILFGGLERLVLYFDLDCRFNVLRLAEVLRCRLMEARGYDDGRSKAGPQKGDGTVSSASQSDDKLFLTCMRRFLYIRCYNSCEFLAALKTMHSQIQKECEAQGAGIHFLMVDSISAFYWMDRASQAGVSTSASCHRRNISLQCITESCVMEIKRLLKMEPVVVLATKATLLGIEHVRNEAQRTSGRWFSEDTSHPERSSRPEIYREFMPFAWQSFVTHRILLRVSESADDSFYSLRTVAFTIYTSQWLLPPLNVVDKFTINDVSISMIP